MRRAGRKQAVWGRVSLLLLFWAALSGQACGPDFPNWLLSDSDEAVSRAPQASFHLELERMRLAATTHTARVAADARADSAEADLADLRKALEQARVPEGEIERVVVSHRAERAQALAYADAPVHVSGEGPRTAPPRVTPGLPPEFADYFRGAVAWYQTNYTAARAEWLRLLQRPAGQRRFKSTWAAFMLGRSWEAEDPVEAIRWYRRVRELAKDGFADSLGLTVASIGWEARLEWDRENHVAAVELYLEQGAAGDPTAENSLRWVAADALRKGRKALNPLARNARTQRLVTAYVISGGYREPEIDVDGPIREAAILLWSRAAAKLSVVPAPAPTWHILRAPAKIWLDAVESAEVSDVEAAEQLALAAYQAGEMDAANRWLDRARMTPAAQWLRAKLLLRDGKIEQAEKLLAAVAAACPADPVSTNAAPSRRLSDNLSLSTGGEYEGFPDASIGQAVRGEMAVVDMTRRRFTDALDRFMHSSPSYWMEAAFIAERVLSLEELLTYVDHAFPEQTSTTDSLEAKPTTRDSDDEMPAPQWRSYKGGEALRYLTARRLARAHRLAEARRYYPVDRRPMFDQLATAWAEAEDAGRSRLERGQALLRAAVLSRTHGLELIGTEVEPDWAIHAGDFDCGVSIASRASASGTNRLATSWEELERANRHNVQPEWRWHYRAVAATIGWEAARMLRDADAAGMSPAERARILFEAGSTLVDHGIACVPFRVEPAAAAPDRTDRESPFVRVSRILAHPAPRPADDGTAGPSSARVTPEELWTRGLTSAALAWEASQVLPNDSDETARVLCRGGRWIRVLDPAAADVLYKSLVRRCRKTAIGAEADRRRWFPPLDAEGNLVSRNQSARAGSAQ